MVLALVQFPRPFEVMTSAAFGAALVMKALPASATTASPAVGR
jgi:hypothetical protein